jgi:hypothetical protein
MVVCPVCGEDNPPDAANCRTCQLATSLFEPVRSAAGSSSDDSNYARALAELLASVVPENGPSDAVSSASGSELTLTSQARFPALASAGPPALAPARRPTLPTLPLLPAGSGLSLVRRQVEDLVQVGRREGLDLSEADRQMSAGPKEEDHTGLEELRRTLFVQVAAAVAEDLDIQTGRRNELAALVPTSTVDVELGSARTAFATGDLSGVVRRLRQASDGLSALEDRWATCQILTTEADLMVETMRELGQDPGPALGPLAEGRRLARGGDADRAERILAGANRALWGALVPHLNQSLQEIRIQLQERAGAETEIEPVIRELRQLAALIRRRNFGAAVAAFRRLRTAAAALPPPAAVGR